MLILVRRQLLLYFPTPAPEGRKADPSVTTELADFDFGHGFGSKTAPILFAPTSRAAAATKYPESESPISLLLTQFCSILPIQQYISDVCPPIRHSVQLPCPSYYLHLPTSSLLLTFRSSRPVNSANCGSSFCSCGDTCVSGIRYAENACTDALAVVNANLGIRHRPPGSQVCCPTSLSFTLPIFGEIFGSNPWLVNRPENILFRTTKDPSSDMVITDFCMCVA